MNKLFLLLLLAACSGAPKQPVKPNIVLLSGFHIDESAWLNVKFRLMDSGYEVTNIGRVGRDTEKPASLKEIAKLSCELTPEKSTIVAHSYGGVIASGMSEVCPTKIKKIIYISAIIPLIGEKAFEQLKRTDQKDYAKVVEFTKEKIHPKSAKEFFKVTEPKYHVDKLSQPKLHPEWMSLTKETVEYNDDVFRKIPKVYIFTLKDTTIKFDTQTYYASRFDIKKTTTMDDAAHFPMLSDPDKLAKEIDNFAR